MLQMQSALRDYEEEKKSHFPKIKETDNAFGREVNNPVYKLKDPPKTDCFRTFKPSRKTDFARFYDRGDFPIRVEHNNKGNSIAWKVKFKELDFHHYLPLFFDGLKEITFPYNFLARQGIHDILQFLDPELKTESETESETDLELETDPASKILPVVPQLIIPIKEALETKDYQIMCTTLKIMQHLIDVCNEVGGALKPYFRQLLPILRQYQTHNKNIGDQIDYSQMKRENLGDLIEETLIKLESNGGQGAFVNINYMVPLYESCLNHQKF